MNGQKTITGKPVPDDIWEAAVKLVGTGNGNTEWERKLVAEGMMRERADCAFIARIAVIALGNPVKIGDTVHDAILRPEAAKPEN